MISFDQDGPLLYLYLSVDRQLSYGTILLKRGKNTSFLQAHKIMARKNEIKFYFACTTDFARE